MSAPTPVLNIEQQFVAALAANYQRLNTAKYTSYQHEYAAWLSKGQQGNPPTVPTLTAFDSQRALIDLLAISAAFGTSAGTNGPTPAFSWGDAITTFQPAALAPPAPPVPPSDLVGPAMGVNDSQGRAMYYTMTGDASPLGTTDTDARGSFVKAGNNTPFGVESYWAKTA